MTRCPITYARLADGECLYSRPGLRSLAPSLARLQDLPFDAEEQRREAIARATTMSIQGVQPKLSARLRIREGRFEVVDRDGTFILKPQSVGYPHLPENEDLTMRLARCVGVETPVHGLVRSRDGSWTYFIRRFDRLPRGRKLAVEDFAQLAGHTRQTKYDASMERVVSVLERFTTYPVVEKLELLRRTLFCFLTGGEDMHLKNWSLITTKARVKLAPAYDLLNSTIALPRATEEIALPLRDKKRNLTRSDLLEYFARDLLGLRQAAIDDLLVTLRDAQPSWDDLIAASFLPSPQKEAYRDLLGRRRERLLGPWPTASG